MTSALIVNGVSVSYGNILAVDDVSFELAQGSVMTIIGANGAGKSSLMNGIMGLTPARGEVHLNEASLRRMPVEQRMASGLSLVPEKRELFGSMTVEDNLLLGGYLLPNRASRERRLQETFDRFPRLRERREQLAATLSGGERQMLAMGRSLMANPRVLMLDEPSLGLAPIIVRGIFEIISTLRSSGISILLVEQNARAAMKVADYVHVMERGRIVRSGSAAELSTDPTIVSSYLGI